MSTANNNSTLSLKISFQDEIRRFTLAHSSNNRYSYNDLLKVVRENYELATVSLKYLGMPNLAILFPFSPFVLCSSCWDLASFDGFFFAPLVCFFVSFVFLLAFSDFG
jgi:hypothetical protein